MIQVQTVINKLASDTLISGWAVGGILNRNPQRTGPDATPTAFHADDMAEMLPTISVVPGVSTQPLSINAPPNAVANWFDIRVFHTASPVNAAQISVVLGQIREVLHMAPLFDGDTFQGYCAWADDLGPLDSPQFADTIYGESHVYVTSLF